jgi:BirA family transcriptional regulator, biotin operon repressor / biotin---[acetyl-CoA-carboxylase] ligase
MTRKYNKNLQKLVNILGDGDYHDGNSIGDALQMTRSAVWKMIKKLDNYAVKITSMRAKGYALLEPLKLLELTKIKKKLVHDKIEIKIFESITSTNGYFKTLRNNKSLRICLAEQQTQGKGRFNREWHSPFGKNIYFSCFYPFQKDLSELAGLSLVMSLAIIKTLKSYGVDKNLFVKWPNDIFYEDKKISGTLIEIQAESHGVCNVVIGIGINVNMQDDENNLSQPWTSLRKILGQYIDRNELCSRLINYLLNYLQEFNSQGFAPFRKEWMQRDCLANQFITLNTLHEKISGTVTGINDQGHLLLKLEDGKIQVFSAGDASIIKKKNPL